MRTLLAAWLALPALAAAQPVALVTDLVGEAKPPILSELAADARVELGRGARLTVLYFASGDEWSFGGPAAIRFGREAPSVLQGEKAVRRPLRVAQQGIQPGGVQPATFVMRNPKPDIEAVRPKADAPLSERVAYAVWLEQIGLKDEAAGYWRALAAERPEAARLRALAGGR